MKTAVTGYMSCGMRKRCAVITAPDNMIEEAVNYYTRITTPNMDCGARINRAAFMFTQFGATYEHQYV